jgi:hypothetical protein
MGELKLPKLPERAPVRVTIGLTPELNRSLEEYADAYQEAYGMRESVADLIPFMLASFLQGDRKFARVRKARSSS